MRSEYVAALATVGFLTFVAVAGPKIGSPTSDGHAPSSRWSVTRQRHRYQQHQSRLSANSGTVTPTTALPTAPVTPATSTVPTVVGGTPFPTPVSLPTDLGKRFETPITPSLVMQDRAIQAATSDIGQTMASQASRTVTQYVLFSDDNYYKQDPSTGQKTYFYQRLPVWIVTFEGLNIPSQGRPDSPTTYNHEYNVVVDATTGQAIQEFTYR